MSCRKCRKAPSGRKGKRRTNDYPPTHEAHLQKLTTLFCFYLFSRNASLARSQNGNYGFQTELLFFHSSQQLGTCIAPAGKLKRVRFRPQGLDNLFTRASLAARPRLHLRGTSSRNVLLFVLQGAIWSGLFNFKKMK